MLRCLLMLELHDARNGKSFRTGIKARSVFARTSATLSGRYCRLRNYNKSMNSYRSIILYRVFKSLRRQGIELRIQDQGCVISTSFCAYKTLRGSCCRRRQTWLGTFSREVDPGHRTELQLCQQRIANCLFTLYLGYPKPSLRE